MRQTRSIFYARQLNEGQDHSGWEIGKSYAFDCLTAGREVDVLERMTNPDGPGVVEKVTKFSDWVMALGELAGKEITGEDAYDIEAELRPMLGESARPLAHTNTQEGVL